MSPEEEVQELRAALELIRESVYRMKCTTAGVIHIDGNAWDRAFSTLIKPPYNRLRWQEASMIRDACCDCPELTRTMNQPGSWTCTLCNVSYDLASVKIAENVRAALKAAEAEKFDECAWEVFTDVLDYELLGC